MVVLVTGASGQLGQSLQCIAKEHPEITFHFYSSLALNITDPDKCMTVFSQLKPNFCINTAAYTAVDKAESEPESARLLNVTAVGNLVQACKKQRTVLLHLSTDFVFDGNAITPYTENDIPNPQSVYGQTKLEGEKLIQQQLEEYFIVRTSWLYSQFGNNFMKTMLRLGAQRNLVSVVNDQIGTPTNAVDLARVLIKMVRSGSSKTLPYGIYNFSNEGSCSWYDFAKEIFDNQDVDVNLNPIPTADYPTAATRPKYSVLDKSSIKSALGIGISDWKSSLKLCLKSL